MTTNTNQVAFDRHESGDYEVSVNGQVVGWLTKVRREAIGDSRNAGHTPAGHTWDFDPELSALKYESYPTFKEAKARVTDTCTPKSATVIGSQYATFLDHLAVWSTMTDGTESRMDLDIDYWDGTEANFKTVIQYHIDQGHTLAAMPYCSGQVYNDLKARKRPDWK